MHSRSPQLTKIWATFNKTAIRNKKLNVRVSLASGAAKSLSVANNTAAASAAQSPARPVGSDSGGAAFASPGSQTSPSGVAARGAYGSRNGGGGSRGGVSRAGGVGGAGLDENSRVLANKYDDVSALVLIDIGQQLDIPWTIFVWPVVFFSSYPVSVCSNFYFYHGGSQMRRRFEYHTVSRPW